MSNVTGSAKRLLVGRALSSEQLGETLLPKRIALPVFASDALSSNAYATQEILLVLSLGGVVLYDFAPWVALMVIVIYTVVVASYRQNVHAYPSGGGDYEVVTTNLGARAGVFVASALLVDYVLTVAVSISAAVANLASAYSVIGEHKTQWAVAVIVVITLMNLRGVRESGLAFAIPTYGFVLGIFGMVGYAIYRIAQGDVLRAESADWVITPEGSFAGAALVFLIARAFSSGTTALTGIEAIANGVPAFRKPKSKNAATTLLMLGAIAMTMFAAITWLALYTQVRVTEFDRDLIGLPEGQAQKTVIAQIADAVFGDFTIGFLYVSFATALILALAANTAFNGFPVLGSVLARDGYLPRQLHTRGDRLAFSNGIVVLAGLAVVLVIAYRAEVTALIQLYILGVFVSFTLSQLGMIKHWNRLLRANPPAGERRAALRSRAINAVGFVMTGSVLIIVLVTKFTKGAWIVCVAMPLIYLLMRAIHNHYAQVRVELAAGDNERVTLPARVHAVVLVSKVHKPTLRALAFARATRPSTLEAVTVDVDEADTARLVADWDRRAIPVPLKVLDSPYREVTRPILDHVRGLRRSSPRDLVIVYVPEYVVGHWWEQILHNQSALRLKSRLLFQPGVMVCAVPWQLASSEGLVDRPEPIAAGAVRRGEPDAVTQDAVVSAEFVDPDGGVRGTAGPSS
ncbi:APC family permease [Longivirga aurantiaca]|uniref:APC family permease n=1 Tax=Longivirga aurantiaca TaxID=1837743 RepID=A0ABW1T0N6_9ACTN